VTTLPFDLVQFFSPVQASLASYRTAMGLPQITGPDGVNSGTLSIGEEWLDFQLAPPGIIIVPSGGRITSFIDSGVSDANSPPMPKAFWTDQMMFEAYCWGDEDPAGPPPAGTQLYSYNSALELRRELLVALAQLGGIPETQPGRYRWEQPAQTNRYGRVLVLEFSLWSPINDNIIGPNIVLPFATDSSSGVQIDAAILATSPDGSSTVQFGVIIAPPA
jgi:hypothetical protein